MLFAINRLRSFPLTRALSLGERENGPQPHIQAMIPVIPRDEGESRKGKQSGKSGAIPSGIGRGRPMPLGIYCGKTAYNDCK